MIFLVVFKSLTFSFPPSSTGVPLVLTWFIKTVSVSGTNSLLVTSKLLSKVLIISTVISVFACFLIKFSFSNLGFIRPKSRVLFDIFNLGPLV